MERLSDAATRFADLGDRHRHADALMELAAVRLKQGLIPEARRHAEQVRGMAVRLGDRLLDAHTLLTLARVNLAEGARATARGLAGEALRIFDDLGHRPGHAEAAGVLSSLPGNGR